MALLRVAEGVEWEVIVGVVREGWSWVVGEASWAANESCDELASPVGSIADP